MLYPQALTLLLIYLWASENLDQADAGMNPDES